VDESELCRECVARATLEACRSTSAPAPSPTDG